MLVTHYTRIHIVSVAVKYMSSSTRTVIRDIVTGRPRLLGEGAPLICGVSITSRFGTPHCLCNPTWITQGRWTCGRHKPYKPVPAPFTPFECAICMQLCVLRKDAMETQCNHSFHKKCMQTWKTSCTRAFSCPMCRSVISKPSSQTYSITQYQLDQLEHRFIVDG